MIRKGEVSCCWTCTPCKENEFVFDEYTCRACELGSWPTDDLTGQSLYVSVSVYVSVCLFLTFDCNLRDTSTLPRKYLNRSSAVSTWYCMCVHVQYVCRVIGKTMFSGRVVWDSCVFPDTGFHYCMIIIIVQPYTGYSRERSWEMILLFHSPLPFSLSSLPIPSSPLPFPPFHSFSLIPLICYQHGHQCF